ncbi:uncharacterized protein LOC136086025 [Hydra vulgaris]|uniref:Uncharacterized protein LOC136086025 n=1 Tax=Hydra vulgaris TaxID=6087 RepID=A0ABM4CR39_HYDVU
MLVIVNFFLLIKLKKDTYICSLHFIGGKGSSEENPHPICASHSKDQLEKNNKRKRKLLIIRNNVSKLKCLHHVDFIVENDNNNINTVSNLSVSSYNTTDFVTVTECNIDDVIAGNSHDFIVDSSASFTATIYDKSTQTIYDKYMLGAKIETIVLKNSLNQNQENQTALLNQTLLNSLHCLVANTMSMENISFSEKSCKYFIGIHEFQFSTLYDFLGPAKYKLSYWNSSWSVRLETKSLKLSANEQLFVTLLKLRRLRLRKLRLRRLRLRRVASNFSRKTSL